MKEITIKSNTHVIIRADNISKLYGKGEACTQILNKVSVDFQGGQIHTILGPSGSGKSTFLYILGGLDNENEGKIIYGNEDILQLSNKELCKFRKKYMGYVFQMYNLIPNLTVRENIEVCESLSSNPLNIDQLINILGLEKQKDKFPAQLSGGQQQRCAIGRALVKNPLVLLCDEPTGALDYKTSRDILILLEEINQKYGTTIIMVTHNNAIKDISHHSITIKDGCIINEENNLVPKKAADLEW